MEIILLQDVDKVGYKFDLVTVKNGYGRNYLIPQKLAVIANDANRKRLAEIQRREEAHAEKMLGEYQAIAERLKTVTLKIGAKTGTSGKIFGSVTSLQVAQALKEQEGIEIERRKIELLEEIKSIGSYTASLNLHKSVDAKVNIEVVEE